MARGTTPSGGPASNPKEKDGPLEEVGSGSTMVSYFRGRRRAQRGVESLKKTN